MNRSNALIKCYTAAFHNTRIDPNLELRGFTHGMIIFSVPALGILFRCRAEGMLIDLEFGAFFALLNFVKTRLTSVNIKAVTILSSNPEFVFSFSKYSRHFVAGSERARLLTEYSRQFKLSIEYIEAIKNKALLSSADYASFSESNVINMEPDLDGLEKISFKPFQKGIRL